MTAVVERRADLIRLEADGEPCVAYPWLTGPVEIGDEVVVNAQARALQLGSGGFDVLYANLTSGLDLPVEEGAHVMKLPYTPMQFASRHGEESAELPDSLDGMPVVACTLHSQVVPVCAALRGVRIAYVQVPGGALPLALSDALHVLKDHGLVELAIGADGCFGGDVDAVNVFSALLIARSAGAEVAVCAIGPGIVGTGTTWGNGGMSAAVALGAASALEGRGVLAARVSERDPRPRHRGVSHHTRAVAAVAGGRVAVPWPSGCPFEPPPLGDVVSVDVDGWRDSCAGLPLRHMGRNSDTEPWFFAAAFAAGRYTRGLVA